jgi:hypothetical protein
LLRAVGLQTIGSRPQTVRPEKKSKGRVPLETLTTELFVAGTRSAFRAWSEELPTWTSSHAGSEQLAAVERLVAPRSEDKIKALPSGSKELLLEAVLHAGSDGYFLQSFKDYLEFLEIEAAFQRRIEVSGLSFIPIFARKAQVRDIAKFRFSYIHCVDQIPR